jgi:N-acetylmuramoyl-L-alanine amidase
MIFSLNKKRPLFVLCAIAQWTVMGYSVAHFAPPKPVKPFVVVLDAGHGGNDPGNVHNGFREKEIALNITLKVGALLEKNPNFKVIYTRKSDVFVDLMQRGKLANQADADLFVSIHCDAHNSLASGASTFVLGLHANEKNFNVAKKENSAIYLEKDFETRYAQYNINSPEAVIGMTIMQEEFLDQSVLLAQLIQNNFVQRLGRKDRQVKQAGFIVLHQTFMPSVLVETGFLSNPTEGAYLNSAQGQQQMSQAIADGILTYHKRINGSTQSVVVAPPKSVNAPKESSSTPINDTENEAVLFAVQLAASKNNLDLIPANFKGLSGVKKQDLGPLFKYFWGHTSSYSEVKKSLVSAQKSGYPSAFVVAFKNGKLVSVQEALGANK